MKKAYKAWDVANDEGWATVVFAETAKEAKTLAMSTDTCEYARFIDIRVNRFPEMDDHDRGRTEIDWNDPEDRKALVALGWSCIAWEAPGECDICPAKKDCWQWETENGQEAAE